MHSSDFEYDLPPALIAQHPLPDRAASRLLVLERSNGVIRHARFRDIVELIAPEDVLVLNVSRVIPARLHGTRVPGSGTRGPSGAAELLLVRELPDGTWLALGHPGGKLKPGRTVRFGDDSAVEGVEGLGGGDDRGAHARELRRRRRLDPAGGRRDAGLHLSPLHVPRGGPAPHEFPPAALDPANVGVRVRGLRARDAGVSGSDRRGVPVLFIWGCDGGHVNAEVRTRNAERKGEHLFRVPDFRVPR